MSRYYGNSGFTMPSRFTIVVNSRNGIIRKVAEHEADEETKLIVRQLYDLAELSRKPLEAEQMTEFIRRSIEIAGMAAK